jgi:antitoxin VapB
MPRRREVRLSKNGRNQAVRIPVGFELPGETALMHREGNRLVIEPEHKSGLLALLATLEPISEDFPDFDADLLPARRLIRRRVALTFSLLVGGSWSRTRCM